MATLPVLTAVIFLVLVASITSAAEQCEDRIFILISSKNVFLYSADRPISIYQAKLDATIEQGVFHKPTNTILLLLSQFNASYSIVSLNALDDPNGIWKERSHAMVYSSRVFLSLGQRYVYVLDPQTMSLQSFSLPLTSSPQKEIRLVNLPRNFQLLNYIAAENVQFLWVLIKTSQQHELHFCHLQNSSCHLYMNIYNLLPPIRLAANDRYTQVYLQSRTYLMIFEYNQNRTDYTIQYLNSTQGNQFLTLCEPTNQIEYVTITNTPQRQVCYQTCQELPFILDDSSDIHTVQRLSALKEILHCSKQRRISAIILLILILADLAVLLGYILWSGYVYYFRPSLEKQLSCGTVWTIEKDPITHF